jgi:hypothetical protein
MNPDPMQNVHWINNKTINVILWKIANYYYYYIILIFYQYYP